MNSSSSIPAPPIQPRGSPRPSQRKVIPFDFAFVDFAAARKSRHSRRPRDYGFFALDADEILGIAHSIPLIETLIAFNERRRLLCGASQSGHYRLAPYRSIRTAPITATAAASTKRSMHQSSPPEAVCLRSNIRIHHSVPSSPESRCRKNHWYIEILKEEIAADPNRPLSPPRLL